MNRPLTSPWLWPNESLLAVAGTPQLLRSGAEMHTFEADVRFIQIMIADLACYIAKDATAITQDANGSRDGRVFVPALSSGLRLPWSGQDVYILNAIAAETPFIAVVGMA